MIQDRFVSTREDVSQEERLLSGLAGIVFNLDESASKYEKGQVLDIVRRIDETVNAQLNEILHHASFQDLEATWRGISGLGKTPTFVEHPDCIA